MNDPLLKVSHLQTAFVHDNHVLKAVNDLSFSIRKGETVALVGESGCGKSVTSLSIMRLLSEGARVLNGSIWFDGVDLLTLPEKEMRAIRGNDMAMVFQEPMTSLNPVYKIGKQIEEAIIYHKKVSKHEARTRTIDILRQVGIPRAEAVIREYPYQLSGGMRQRVMIAMAMVCEPKLLIADEPTTALDVTIQAQILDLMKTLNREKGTAILLITHDLGVVAEMCERVFVMYCGKIVESNDVKALFADAKHPYTKGLLNATPKLGQHVDHLGSIKGSVPNLNNLPEGCLFAPRCPNVMAVCQEKVPELELIEGGGLCRCFLHKRESVFQGGDF
ncbi:ABC transporter ATP-binding protein [Sporolactobacillus terrae]|uniref:Peptide ABC transporter ATP-binding protein n=1 Tax=Sporolactobacillus terrae TaxID=269673 RepID=A0ABX5Q4T5_9BACL|nr:ABC transporter ATP-binding protein [Sporolactobacillus terrae]QAA21663.1 peptide ABC transporter ATP-binding protein [Sporolactobacillus terrae]QAA24635.1 peptide ABC transporter ATP-binding protein [Sporolactobacillus terrae]UAK16471.1 ABC transporter ATP-binding protein [Sporolactobacillus terrae]